MIARWFSLFLMPFRLIAIKKDLKRMIMNYVIEKEAERKAEDGINLDFFYNFHFCFLYISFFVYWIDRIRIQNWIATKISNQFKLFGQNTLSNVTCFREELQPGLVFL